jgi:hypothetical protein
VTAETDGGTVPVVVTDENAEDRRGGKKYIWKEARLSIAHVPGDTTLRFGAEFQESVEPACSGKNEKGSWVNLQKEFLKSGHAEKVIEALQPHSEPETTEDRNAPVRRRLRYLRNRPGQFDYPEAQARGLPVGSGEIESAHRYVIQERLKIAGAWRMPENARFMLALRVDRADGYREKHWDNMRRAA